MALDLLEQILPHVRRAKYPQAHLLEEWKIKESDLDDASDPRLNDKSWPTFRIPSFWGGYDRSAWFRRSVVVPPEFSGKPVALLLDIPEGLVYVNGKPYQGVDRNHPEIVLTGKSRTNQTFHIAIQAYSGRTTDVSNFNDARLAVIDPVARTLSYGLSLLRDLDRMHRSSASDAKEIKELIRKTLIFLKYYSPEGEEYPNAIGRALNYLRTTIEEEHRSDTAGTIHLVGQSHLDVLWLWTLKETRRKTARTFSTAARLLEEFPAFKFSQPQAQLYQFVDEDYPSLAKEIRGYIKEGRWEVLSGMWVEADCNIPAGESLVRQILYGKKYSNDQLGVDPLVLWLPDSFGFPASIPQIMQQAGLRYFFTTKLAWNDTTQHPYHSFRWKGLDGSTVVAHIPPIGLEGQVQAKYIRASWQLHHQSESSPLVLQTFGFGDGGGGPTKEHIITSEFLRDLAGFPRLQTSNVVEFFQQLEQTSPELPIWEGDLYLEKHRGTFTTNTDIKKHNRKSETALYSAELLNVLSDLNRSGRTATRYPAAELTQAWKSVLLNQFHDTICGTIIRDAEKEVIAQYEETIAFIDSLVARGARGLQDRPSRGGNETVVTVFNTLPWPRTGYVEFSLKSSDRNISITDDLSRPVEHQIIQRSRGFIHVVCYLQDVPPMSSMQLRVSPGKSASNDQPGWKVKPRMIETPIFRIRLDPRGDITSLYDKRLRRELTAKGGKINEFQTFADRPKEWEAWELDPEFESKRHQTFRFDSGKVFEAGPLRATLRLVYKSSSGSTLTQDLMMYHQIAFLEMRTRLKWSEKQTLLKVAFPLNIKSSHFTNEIQFGSVQHTMKPKTPQEKAKYELPTQQWIDFSDNRCGVSILNDSRHGFDAKENTIRLTLLRSPHYPHDTDPQKLSGSGIIDKGEHEFRYGLYVHHGDWKKGETGRRAREFNHPFLVFVDTPLREIDPLLTNLPKPLLVDAVKKSEDGSDVIVRLHESFGEQLRAPLDFGYHIDQVSECNLLEQPVKKLKSSRGKVRLRFSPFEIKTLRVQLRPQGKTHSARRHK